MTKQRLQGFIAGLLIAILLISTLALASGTLREVFYGVNVVVNGELQHFDDDMQPFISDGRTFLPVRGISEALGVPINWDGTTNTVYIGDMPEFATIEDGYLKVATNIPFPPFQFASNAATAVDGVDGICIAIAKVIAEELGLQLRVIDMDFMAIIPTVQAGTRVDIGMAGMTITEERAQNVDFIPYFNSSQVIVTAVASGIQSAADLAGLRVGVVLNYTGDIIVSYSIDGIAEIVRSNSGAELALELINGRVDAIVIDMPPAQEIIRTHPDFIIIEDTDVFLAENFGISIRQGNTGLRIAINAIVERLIADGTIDAITARYILN